MSPSEPAPQSRSEDVGCLLFLLRFAVLIGQFLLLPFRLGWAALINLFRRRLPEAARVEVISSDTVVFDNADWHADAVAELGLPEGQALVHSGLFLAWAASRGLATGLSEESQEALRRRERTGAEILEDEGGKLASSQFSEQGSAFAADYLDNQRGEFLNDYETILAASLPSSYHVEDSWENLDRIAATMDRRFAEWEAEQKLDSDSGGPD